MVKETYVKAHLIRFPWDSIRFCSLRQAKLSSALFTLVYFLRASSAQSLSRRDRPVFTYRSLISLAVSQPPHLAVHVILISSFITDVIALLL